MEREEMTKEEMLKRKSESELWRRPPFSDRRIVKWSKPTHSKPTALVLKAGLDSESVEIAVVLRPKRRTKGISYPYPDYEGQPDTPAEHQMFPGTEELWSSPLACEEFA
ncbi:hypothetical protein P7K49_008166 [Saguinus oedipus]|uniref:Uncharacterized protein n=1 Tax=Saguinus oedipus TaxID=9490 RepID=A0ABQ9VWZ8_SAGOE|nr:hypothetical protein P7K49_008166 [Saguinus oedipus]